MMLSTSASSDRLNDRLARLLVLGTLTSCGLILIGIVLPALGAASDRAGIILSRPESCC